MEEILRIFNKIKSSQTSNKIYREFVSELTELTRLPEMEWKISEEEIEEEKGLLKIKRIRAFKNGVSIYEGGFLNDKPFSDHIFYKNYLPVKYLGFSREGKIVHY